MLRALNRHREASPEVLLKDVREAIDAFAGDAEQFDDITMLCIQYNGKEMDTDEGMDAAGRR
jgi:sigma-B regulation protein RsbU (phosphoserine phosphatase)